MQIAKISDLLLKGNASNRGFQDDYILEGKTDTLHGLLNGYPELLVSREPPGSLQGRGAQADSVQPALGKSVIDLKQSCSFQLSRPRVGLCRV